MKKSSRRRLAPAPLWFVMMLAATLGAGAGACDDSIGPGGAGIPDVSGLWSGQYVVTGCTLRSASDPNYCADVFPVGASLILEMDLDQAGDEVFGVMGQGTLVGDVDGVIDENGVLFLTGILGSDTLTTSEILAWQTGLVGDSLLGSWRFEVVDQADRGFGIATVDANMRLLGPSVLKLFGCPVKDELLINNQLSGQLHAGDCEFADATLFDLYRFRGSAGDSVEIALRSPAFDAFLLISDVDENELGADDNSGGGGNGTDAALIVVFDESGTILLAANTAFAGESGPYTLTATRLGPVTARSSGVRRRSGGAGIRVVGGDGDGGRKRNARELRTFEFRANRGS